MELRNPVPLSSSSSSSSTTTMPSGGSDGTGVPRFFVNVTVNLGFPFFGMWLSCILFGVLTFQTWRYFQIYPRDSLSIKSLVAVLWILDALDLSFITYVIYRCIVPHFGDLLVLVQMTWTSIIHGGISCLITLLVQIFFARRVWVLSGGHKLITTAVLGFSLVSFGAGLHFMIRSFFEINDPSRLPRYSKGTFIASAVVADALIAGAQCFYLERNKTGVPRVDSVVKVMMVYIINTMVLTTAIAVLELVLWTARNDSTHLLPDWTICRFYSNSLLAVLNTRQEMLEQIDTELSMDDFVVVRGGSLRSRSFPRGDPYPDSFILGSRDDAFAPGDAYTPRSAVSSFVMAPPKPITRSSPRAFDMHILHR